jgi:drug/metabolite transporter (DMT)-like permease
MQSVFLVLLIAFLWGTADLIRKLTVGSNFKIISLLFNLGTILIPVAVVVYTLIKKTPLKYSRSHLGIALVGGTLAGLGGLLLFYTLSKGVGISTTIPVLRVLSIVLVAIGGVLFFGEPITFKFVSGLLLALSGVYLLLS